MENSRSCSYTVTQKMEGRLRLLRLALLLLYFAFSCTYVILAAPRIPWLIAILPIFLWILIFFTWRLLKISYCYQIESGHLVLFRAKENQKQKRAGDYLIKDLTQIAPVPQPRPKQTNALLSIYSAQKVLFFASSLSSPDLYSAIATESDGKRTLLLFDATAQSLRLLHYYNSDTIVTQVRY